MYVEDIYRSRIEAARTVHAKIVSGGQALEMGVDGWQTPTTFRVRVACVYEPSTNLCSEREQQIYDNGSFLLEIRAFADYSSRSP